MSNKFTDHMVEMSVLVDTDEDMAALFEAVESLLLSRGLIEKSDIVGVLDYR